MIADVEFAVGKGGEIPSFAADLHAHEFFVTIGILFENHEFTGVGDDDKFVADGNGG